MTESRNTGHARVWRADETRDHQAAPLLLLATTPAARSCCEEIPRPHRSLVMPCADSESEKREGERTRASWPRLRGAHLRSLRRSHRTTAAAAAQRRRRQERIRPAEGAPRRPLRCPSPRPAASQQLPGGPATTAAMAAVPPPRRRRRGSRTARRRRPPTPTRR